MLRSVDRGRGLFACLDSVFGNCFLLGVTLAGITLSSGLSWVEGGVNPIG